MFRHSWITIVAVLVSFVFALLLQSALVRATIEDLSGKQPSFGDCIRIAVRYLLPTLGIGLLVALGAGLASIALLVPGIIVAWLVSGGASFDPEQLGVSRVSRSRLTQRAAGAVRLSLI